MWWRRRQIQADGLVVSGFCFRLWGLRNYTNSMKDLLIPSLSMHQLSGMFFPLLQNLTQSWPLQYLQQVSYNLFHIIFKGVVVGHTLSRKYPLLTQRLLQFHGVAHLFNFFALSMLFLVPYYRLTGFWDNGLRWKIPDIDSKKYDTTSDFIKSSNFYKYLIARKVD